MVALIISFMNPLLHHPPRRVSHILVANIKLSIIVHFSSLGKCIRVFINLCILNGSLCRPPSLVPFNLHTSHVHRNHGDEHSTEGQSWGVAKIINKVVNFSNISHCVYIAARATFCFMDPQFYNMHHAGHPINMSPRKQNPR